MGEKAGAEHKFQFYDSDKGTFLGRTGGSWGKFLWLYGFYYRLMMLFKIRVPNNCSFISPSIEMSKIQYYIVYLVVYSYFN